VADVLGLDALTVQGRAKQHDKKSSTTEKKKAAGISD
jgi:hypothetical protein